MGLSSRVWGWISTARWDLDSPVASFGGCLASRGVADRFQWGPAFCIDVFLGVSFEDMIVSLAIFSPVCLAKKVSFEGSLVGASRVQIERHFDTFS